PIVAIVRPAIFDRDVCALDVPRLLQALLECVRHHRIPISGRAVEKSDHGYSWLLCASAERPRRCRAEQGDELAASHSITSSARNKSDVGTDSPRVCAVRMLSTVSNFAGRSIGNSAGLAPRRTFPASTPVNRYRFSTFGP